MKTHPKSFVRRARIQHSMIEMLEPRIAPATFTVANLNDSGVGSLRQAIINANLTPATDTIVFANGLAGTILLTTGEMDVVTPVNLVGPGPGKITINANNASRIFDVTDSDPNRESRFSISGLSLILGNATSSFGGAIRSDESLSVNRCVISNCSADADGGGIFVDGGAATHVSIRSSIITGNSAVNSGGGVFLDAKAGITITGAKLLNNSAGLNGGGATLGVADATGSLAKVTVANSLFQANGSQSRGGGLSSIMGGQPLTVTGTDFIGNRSLLAGGGFHVEDAVLTLRSCDFLANQTLAANGDGGGLFAGFGVRGSVIDGRFIGNTTFEDGGGLAFHGGGDATNVLTITGGTVFNGNSAGNDGGAIVGYDGGKLVIRGGTFHGNRALNGEGGAVSVFQPGAGVKIDLEVRGGLYEGNLALNSGAIDTFGDGTVLVRDAKFTGNYATGDGGAMNLRTNTTGSIINCIFNGNRAQDQGGAIALAGSGTKTLTGLRVMDNSAFTDGGGLTVFAGTVNISSSMFKENYTNGIGGGIRASGGTVNITTSLIAENVAKTDSGGIAKAAAAIVNLTATARIINNTAPTNPNKNF